MFATTGAVLALRWATSSCSSSSSVSGTWSVALLTWAVIDLVFLTLQVQLMAPNQLVPADPGDPGSDGGRPAHYYFPGAAIVGLSVTMFTILYAMVPARHRVRAGAAVVVLLALVSASRILLASAYPSALLYGAILGAVIVELVF